MNNENEIERMASIIIKHPLESHASAVELSAQGIGDKKQAVKEFAEKLKGLCDEKRKLFEKLYDKCAPRQAQLANSFIERRNEWIEMKQKIDNLITELYGGNKNEN